MKGTIVEVPFFNITEGPIGQEVASVFDEEVRNLMHTHDLPENVAQEFLHASYCPDKLTNSIAKQYVITLNSLITRSTGQNLKMEHRETINGVSATKLQVGVDSTAFERVTEEVSQLYSPIFQLNATETRILEHWLMYAIGKGVAEDAANTLVKVGTVEDIFYDTIHYGLLERFIADHHKSGQTRDGAVTL